MKVIKYLMDLMPIFCLLLFIIAIIFMENIRYIIILGFLGLFGLFVGLGIISLLINFIVVPISRIILYPIAYEYKNRIFSKAEKIIKLYNFDEMQKNIQITIDSIKNIKYQAEQSLKDKRKDYNTLHQPKQKAYSTLPKHSSIYESKLKSLIDELNKEAKEFVASYIKDR